MIRIYVPAIVLMIAGSSFAAELPNIVVIMADDLGYADVGFLGCKDISTPNIDQLAASGVRFSQGYVTGCMCGPSRAGFITGRNQSTFGYYRNAAQPLDPKQGLPAGMKTVAHFMQSHGYATGGVGKWHMGTADHQHPGAMGYSDWFGFLGGGLMYYPLDHPSYGRRYLKKTKPWGVRDMHHTLPMLHNGKPVEWKQYLTRELTDGGIRFIEKNREQPFFLFVSYNAPHEYLEAPAETIAKYPPESMTEVPGVPAKSRSIYAAMVDEMDQGIGRLMETLDNLDLAHDTVVWFLSDHGGLKRTSDNRPLRGAKGNAYEGGLRVPFVVRWPEKIKPGIVLDHPVTSLDIGATSLALAGGDVKQAGLHGNDITSYMTGGSTDAPHDVLYWHIGNSPQDISGVIRDGDYKLLAQRGRVQLFNIKDDPTECTDLAKAEPQRAERMLAQWKTWNESNSSLLWDGSKSRQANNDYQYADSLNVSWHYNWGSRISTPEPAGVEYVPMIYGFWGANDGFNRLITELAGDKDSGKHDHLLGFNEPDHKDQANMSVEKAMKGWPYLEKTGLRLGSPGAAHAHKEWMQKFMREAENRNYRVDFVAVHWYGGPNPDSFINYLKKIHRMYRKPIWVTEFAVADWNAKSLPENRHSIGEVHRFMKNVLPRLDELDFVERYAWFSAGPNNVALGTSSLFKPDGSLTWIGKHYAAHNRQVGPVPTGRRN